MIDIIKAGLQTSVQDLGRTGLRHLGVTQSGALDSVALRAANRLVGNADNAAGLEITVGQTVSLGFTTATRIALTGADCGATLDGDAIYAWWSIPVSAGQVLTLGVPSRGMRAYLAIAGGIDVASMLGSRSTDLAAGFGGLKGRALRDGDVVPLQSDAANPGATPAVTHDAPALPMVRHAVEGPAFGVKSPAWCDFAQVPPALHTTREFPRSGAEPQWVRVLRGPEYASFNAAAHHALWNAEWIVTPNSNRMGYRLSGPTLIPHETKELLSHAVLPGTVQVPPNGQPILLMGDAQTAGGYPKIGSVITADLWLLAQTRLNTPLRFVECSLAEARVALQRIEDYFKQLDIALKLRHEQQAKAAA